MTAGWYAAAPFVAGALGNVCAGWLVDRIYRSGRWTAVAAAPGHRSASSLAAGGLVASASDGHAGGAVAWLSRRRLRRGHDAQRRRGRCASTSAGDHAGAVSGTMNMAGNLGSFVTALAFPYLLAWTGSSRVVLLHGAPALNLLAVGAWLLIRPDRPIEDGPGLGS